MFSLILAPKWPRYSWMSRKSLSVLLREMAGARSAPFRLLNQCGYQVEDLCWHCFERWLGARSAPIRFLNQCGYWVEDCFKRWLGADLFPASVLTWDKYFFKIVIFHWINQTWKCPFWEFWSHLGVERLKKYELNGYWYSQTYKS